MTAPVLTTTLNPDDPQAWAGVAPACVSVLQ
jgi:hypothetical protein